MNVKIRRFGVYSMLLMMVFLTSHCGRSPEESDRLTPHEKDLSPDVREVLEQSVPEETGARIAQALKVADALKQIKGNSDIALNTCTLALKQPQFTGSLARDGAVVLFDEQDEPVQAMTTREIDYQTGANFQARPFTDDELRKSAGQLKSYHTLLKSQGNDARCIVIFSQSFRLAVCDGILNKDDNVEWALRRALKSAQLVRVGPTGSNVVVSEAIYYDE